MENFKKYWNKPVIATVIIFVVFFTIFISIFAIADGDPVPDDQYFHIKYAYLLRTEGWNVVEHFKWIQAGPEPTEGGHYTVSLFQISLIPFTYFDDLMVGLRVAEAFYASIVLCVFYYIMRKDRAKKPLLFTMLLASSSFFIMRMLLSRALVLMVGFVFLEIYLAIHRKYVLFILVSILHVLWHQNTYFMPVIVIAVVELARYFMEKKVYIKNIMAVLIGVVIGMAFFPGFPRSLFSLFKTIVGIMGNATNEAAAISLGGNELKLIDFSDYFVGNLAMFIVCLISIALVMYLYLKQRKNNINFTDVQKIQLHWVYSLFIFLSFVVVGSWMISGRFFDFVFPAGLLLASFSITLLIETNIITFKKETIEWINVFVSVFVVILFAGSMFIVYKKANTFSYDPARLVAKWIDDNSEGGEKVYLNNWSHFNMMFFENSNNVYSMGIEPYSLKLYDESLYWKYYNIFANTYYCEKLGDCKEELKSKKYLEMDKESQEEFAKENGRKIINSIKNDFGAKFIVSDSHLLTDMILLNPELIDNSFAVKAKKYKGSHMDFAVFKLK